VRLPITVWEDLCRFRLIGVDKNHMVLLVVADGIVARQFPCDLCGHNTATYVAVAWLVEAAVVAKGSALAGLRVLVSLRGASGHRLTQLMSCSG
jgi:hypothetical protein